MYDPFQDPDLPNVWPCSIRGINDLPDRNKEAVYRTLLPPWMAERFNVDPRDLTINGVRAVHIRCPRGSRAVEIELRYPPDAEDPIGYLQMVDTFNGQIQVLMVILNDPDSPRFDIDRDENGNPTYFGTVSRNIPAEIAAMKAGLAPGQVRAGLRGFRHTVPVFERFIRHMHHDIFFIEPLAYHNAIAFERYGFNYTRGLKTMQWIDREFRPGGELHAKLDGSTPFRHPDAWRTVRGRSWAIHDGILGYPFQGFQMYKRIGRHAGISTFPDAVW